MDGTMLGGTGQKPLAYQVANLQGIGARERQEDGFAFVNAISPDRAQTEGLFALICDGMGGMADGKVACETAIASLVADFKSSDRMGDLPAQMVQSLRIAGQKVYAKIGGMGGTTAIFCIFNPKRYLFFK